LTVFSRRSPSSPGPARWRRGSYRNGAKAGSFRVNNLGNGHLNRNSDRGQSVPRIAAGTQVQIKTAGVLVVSGSF